MRNPTPPTAKPSPTIGSDFGNGDEAGVDGDLGEKRRDFRNGEGFLYLGRSYRLSLVDGTQTEPLTLKDGRFCLRRALAQTPAGARAAFAAYYTSRGLERMAASVRYYASKIGITPGRLALRHRWASCSPKGNLAFYWKCMLAPLTVIDYLVVHELCHLHALAHTEAFWNEVDKNPARLP